MNSEIDRLRELTESLVEAPLAQQFQDASTTTMSPIRVEVEEGYAQIRLLAQYEIGVIAVQGALRGTCLSRQVRSETWTIVVLSGELTVDEDGTITTYRSRDSFKAVSGKAYKMSWEEDSMMVVIAIPDVKELLGVSHAA